VRVHPAVQGAGGALRQVQEQGSGNHVSVGNLRPDWPRCAINAPQ
jgi:hypothetical protein